MRRYLRAAFWLFIAVLYWLYGALQVVPMMACSAITGCINRKFDALFKDF